MPRLTTAVTFLISLVGLTAGVRAEHAKVTLELATGRDQVAASVDQTPPDWGKSPRKILKAKAHEPIRFNFILTNVYPHKTLENVVVHFFIAPQKAAGQKELPEIKNDVVLEAAFEMDFKPGGKAGQRGMIRIEAPGAYLVRVETRNTQSDHEHFAAIDLVVTDDATGDRVPAQPPKQP